MTVVVIQTFEATREQYDAVNGKVNVANDPPAGKVIHTASAIGDGKMKSIDVWDSEADFQSFRESRLGPAVVEVAGEDASAPDIEVYEAFDVAKP